MIELGKIENAIVFLSKFFIFFFKENQNA